MAVAALILSAPAVIASLFINVFKTLMAVVSGVQRSQPLTAQPIQRARAAAKAVVQLVNAILAVVKQTPAII
jgi:hypothetical protein